MTRRTKTMILSICLIAALMLTACQTHVDSDPWPASDGVTATDAPETTQDAGGTCKQHGLLRAKQRRIERHLFCDILWHRLYPCQSVRSERRPHAVQIYF